jgi:hypothetical protein
MIPTVMRLGSGIKRDADAIGKFLTDDWVIIDKD